MLGTVVEAVLRAHGVVLDANNNNPGPCACLCRDGACNGPPSPTARGSGPPSPPSVPSCTGNAPAQASRRRGKRSGRNPDTVIRGGRNMPRNDPTIAAAPITVPPPRHVCPACIQLVADQHRYHTKLAEAGLWEEPEVPDTKHGTIHAFGLQGEHYHWPAHGAQGPFFVVTAGLAVGIFTNRSLVTTITSFTPASCHSVHFDFKEAFNVWYTALTGNALTICGSPSSAAMGVRRPA